MSLFQKAMKSWRREMKKSSLAALLVRVAVAGHLVGIPGLVAGLVESLVASLVLLDRRQLNLSSPLHDLGQGKDEQSQGTKF